GVTKMAAQMPQVRISRDWETISQQRATRGGSGHGRCRVDPRDYAATDGGLGGGCHGLGDGQRAGGGVSPEKRAILNFAGRGERAEWRLASDNGFLMSSLARKPKLKSCNTNGEIKPRLAAQ